MPSSDDMIPPLLSEPFGEIQRPGGNASGGVPIVPPSSGNIFVRGFEWRMFLRMGDHDVALAHGSFLRGQEEFEGVPSRARIRSLENDAFRVSFSCNLSIGHMMTSDCPCTLRCLWFSP